MPTKPKQGAKKKQPPPASPPPPKVPHPVDDLIAAEPKMDEKLRSLDGRKLGRLRRIARLERGFCGEAEW